MNLESFADYKSQIHGLNPTIKLLSAVVFSFQIAMSYRFSTLISGLAISCILLSFSRLPLGSLFKRLRLVNLMVILCMVILPLTAKSEIYWTFGFLKISKAGLELALIILLKSYTIVLAIIALVSTSNVSALSHSLDQLKIPKKLVLLLTLTYRYLFVLEQEYKRLLTAAQVRCFRPKNNLHTYKTYAYLVGMLLVRASAKGEQVYKAMLCRGFRGEFHTIKELSFSRKDKYFAILMTIAILGLGVLEWMKKTTLLSI